MKNIKLFEDYEYNTPVAKDPYLVSSRKNLLFYQFQSFDTFKSFTERHEEIFKDVIWPINPVINKRSPEFYFNSYLKQYPIFCVIIDQNENDVIGFSCDSSGDVKIGVNKEDRKIGIKNVKNYLKILGIEKEDII